MVKFNLSDLPDQSTQDTTQQLSGGDILSQLPDQAVKQDSPQISGLPDAPTSGVSATQEDVRQREMEFKNQKGRNSTANRLNLPVTDMISGGKNFAAAINAYQKDGGSVLTGIGKGIVAAAEAVDSVMDFGGKELNKFFGGAAAHSKVQSEIDKRYEFQKTLLDKENNPTRELDLRVLEQNREAEKNEAMNLDSDEAVRLYGDLGKVAVQVASSKYAGVGGVVTKNLPLAARFLARTGIGLLQGGAEGFGSGYFDALADGKTEEEAMNDGKRTGLWGAILQGGLNSSGGSFKQVGKEDVLSIVKGNVKTANAEKILSAQRYVEPGFFKKLFKGNKDIVATKQNIADTKAVMNEIPNLKTNNLQKFVGQLQSKASGIYKTIQPEMEAIGINSTNGRKVGTMLNNINDTLTEYKGSVTNKNFKLIEGFWDDVYSAKNADEIWKAKTKFTKNLPEDVITGSTKKGDDLVGQSLEMRDAWQKTTKQVNDLLSDLSENSSAEFKRDMKRFSLLNRVEDGALTFAKDFSKIKGMIPENLRQAAVTALLFKLLGESGMRLGRAS